ncbi:MAG: hypothetical protein RBT47_11440 [Anaerolineae bacterium]|jgi:hypothetical protein|nr:hypothetical protein [Anaerolineae bacterium]
MSESQSFKAFLGFAWKCIVAHVVTYFFFGLIMSNVFHYGQLFQQEIIRDFMRPLDSPYVTIGPFLQPLRGLLFAVALWPIRSLILEKKHGWLIVWNLIVMLGILSTPAAAPCSVEGVLYSKLPLWYHLLGLPEIVLQTLAFSLILVGWDQWQSRQAEAHAAMPPVLAEVMKALMIGCFAYIGYAVGALSFVALSGLEVDMEAASGDMKTQMMFVVVLIVNVIAVFFISRLWQKGVFPLWRILVAFWGIDGIVLCLYKWLVIPPASPFMALLLSLLPAVIITVSIRLNYLKYDQV